MSKAVFSSTCNSNIREAIFVTAVTSTFETFESITSCVSAFGRDGLLGDRTSVPHCHSEKHTNLQIKHDFRSKTIYHTDWYFLWLQGESCKMIASDKISE